MLSQFNCNKICDYFKKITKEEEMLSKSIADMTIYVEVAQSSSFIDFTRRYNEVISNINLDVAKKSGLTSIKKYRRYGGQVKIKLDWLNS